MIAERESITAKLCSFARAYHSLGESKGMFNDFLAYDLMGSEEYGRIGRLIENDFDDSKSHGQLSFNPTKVYRKLDRYISPIPLSRIAFAESELASFAKENGPCQYVICGAGMDSFSFRNKNRNIKIFEVDHPDTQRYKLQRIRKLNWEIPSNVTYCPC
ncbi:MAG: class I SAM-dependent methyltransferase [Catonella sp.]|nr:class I SAM-dependent methyltransferase [Catonella sp.]MDY6356104.1 class I SAM-dependent methyltransferase [Catonella sp.]